MPLRAHATLLATVGALLIGANAQAPAQQSRIADTLYLTHFDVGQGDATLITTYRGRRVLIDAGSSGGAIARRLRQVGIDTLDLLISSHNHQDHIGGIPDVFAALTVRKYIDNRMGCPRRTDVCQMTFAYANAESGLEYLDPAGTHVIDGVTFRLLPPARVDLTENNNSVGVIVEYGAFRALYTGDSEIEQLGWWLRSDAIPRVNVLKAAHHGSDNGVTMAWIAKTQPSTVVISVGCRNSFSHPSAAILFAWLQTKARVHRTDHEGTIQVKALSDGSYMVKAEGQARPCSRP